MTYVHRNVKRRMALEGVKRHTRFSTYSWWRPGVYLALIIVDCGQGNIVALFGLKKSGKDLRPQRLQVGLSLIDPHAIGSLLGCNHIFATSFSWVQTLVPSMLSRWPWCHFYFILFFIFLWSPRWHQWPFDQPWWMGLVMNVVAYIACSLLQQEGLGDIGLVPDL